MLGVAATLTFGLVAYRQTIGARRERARLANEVILKVLEKRLVLEGTLPSGDELENLLGSKAQAERIARSSLPSVVDLYGAVRLRIWENDFLDEEKRQSHQKKIAAAITTMEETTLSAAAGEYAARRSSVWSLAFLWASASTIGLAVSLAAAQSAGLLGGRGSLDNTLALVAQLSIIVTLAGLATVLALRARERLQNLDVDRDTISLGYDLERRAIRAMANAKVRPLQGNAGADFIVDSAGPTVVEVKAWPGRLRRVPNVLVHQALEQLARARERLEAKHALLVTEEKIELPPDLEAEMDRLGVRTVPLANLRAELARLSKES